MTDAQVFIKCWATLQSFPAHQPHPGLQQPHGDGEGTWQLNKGAAQPLGCLPDKVDTSQTKSSQLSQRIWIRNPAA